MSVLNIDENIQKILQAVLKKWKLLVIFALIGAILYVAYTARFTVDRFSSSIEFLAYTVDSTEELSGSSESTQSTSSQRVSETSKMNYAMKMLDTYIEIFSTNEFNQFVADTINDAHGTSYFSGTVKNALIITKVENTAMFRIDVTTTDADLSYNIATALEECIPRAMSETNNGLVSASVQDPPQRAASAASRGYPKKAILGAVFGIVIAAAYAVLRDFLDVRIRTASDLTERYDIPVLGSVPDFNKRSSSGSKKRGAGDKTVYGKGVE